MLGGLVGLPTDAAARTLATGVGRMTPLPALLADGDTDLGLGASDEALATQNDDALVNQAPRTSSGGGVPDIEVGGSNSAPGRLLDDAWRVGQLDVDVQRGGEKPLDDVGGKGILTKRIPIAGEADDPQEGLRHRGTSKDFVLEVGIRPDEPTAHDRKVGLVWHTIEVEGPASVIAST